MHSANERGSFLSVRSTGSGKLIDYEGSIKHIRATGMPSGCELGASRMQMRFKGLYGRSARILLRFSPL